MFLAEAASRRCFVIKVVLKNFVKFTAKHLRPATVLKRRPCHRCSTVNFVKFLRTPFLQNTSGRLLLLFFETHECLIILESPIVIGFNFFKQRKNIKLLYFKLQFKIRFKRNSLSSMTGSEVSPSIFYSNSTCDVLDI